MTVQPTIYFSLSNEYVYKDSDKYFIGITEYLIDKLGNIIEVNLPQIGEFYRKGEILGYVESVNAASEIYMPISGRIDAINESILQQPKLLNEEPFEKMWLVQISSQTYDDDVKDLLDYENYTNQLV